MVQFPLSNQETVDKKDEESDYGSEFGTDDETALSLLVTQVESTPSSQTPVRKSIEGKSGIQVAYEHDTVPIIVTPRTRRLVYDYGVPFQALAFTGPVREASVEVEYDPRNRIAFSRKL